MSIFIVVALVIGFTFAWKPKVGVLLLAPILFGWTLLFVMSPQATGEVYWWSLAITGAYCGFMWLIGVFVRE